MEIKSSRAGRTFWLILGLGLAGSFVIGNIFVTVQSGPSPVLIVTSLFPIGLGIATILWLGRPAWIRVDATEVSFVPPLGSAKVFPRTSVNSIVRVRRAKGTSNLEFRDHDNRRLVAIEQGFAMDDVQQLAQFLDVKLSWDPQWTRAPRAGSGSDEASRAQALQEMMATMTPEERAELEKHMKKSDGNG